MALDLLLKLALLALLVALTGMSSVWALLKGAKPMGAVLAGSLTLALFLGSLLYMGSSEAPAGTNGSFQPFFDQVWERQAQWLSSQEVSPDKVAAAKVLYEKYIVQCYLAWSGLACLVFGLLAYYLSSAVFSRITPKVPRAVAFREWLIPEPLIFGFLAGAILRLVFPAGSPWEVLGNNLLVFFVGLYTLGGFSIVSFFFHKWRLPMGARLAGYLVILVLLDLVFEPICCFGMLDVWFDFRKLKTAMPGPTA